MPRRRLWEAVVEPGGVPPDGRVEPVLVARRQEPAEGGERGALQRPGVVVAGAVEGPVGGGEINVISSLIILIYSRWLALLCNVKSLFFLGLLFYNVLIIAHNFVSITL